MSIDCFADRFSQVVNFLGISITPSPSESPHGIDPMRVLPSEIMSEIFSLLDQDDCLACLIVSRHWYSVVPMYSRTVWKELRLRTRVAHMDHHLCERCVGDHVRKIVIEPSFERNWAFLQGKASEKDVYVLMQKCLDWGCSNIESIEFILCSIQCQSIFHDHLKQLAPNLKRLKIIKLYTWLSIPHLLYAFPELSHLTYQATSSEHYSIDDTRIPLFHVPSDYQTKITYLCLSIGTTKEWKESIARRCPNLRCFIDDSLIFNAAWGAIDLDSLFTWCPDITFLKVNAVENRNWRQDPDAYISKSPGLRLYDANDNYGFDQVAQQLKKSQETLQYLRLYRVSGTIGPDWSPVFSSLQMPNLRHLILRGSKFTFASIASMLNHCPALESLALFFMTPNLLLGSAVAQSLRTIQHLKCLQLDGIIDGDGQSLLTMLERFPSLQQLFIYRSSLTLGSPTYFEGPQKLEFLDLNEISWKCDGSGDMETAVAHFMKCLTNSTKLESLRLQDVPTIGRGTLQIIAKIRTLKYLDLLIDNDTVHDQDLLQFVKTLSKTAIDTLKLCNIARLTFSLLEALIELPLLSMLCTGSQQYKPSLVTEVDEGGLMQLLSKSPNLVAVVFSNETTVFKCGTRDPLTEDQLRALLKVQRTPSKASRGWSMELGPNYRRSADRSNVIHRNVIIKCCDLHFSSRFYYGHSTKVPPMF